MASRVTAENVQTLQPDATGGNEQEIEVAVEIDEDFSLLLDSDENEAAIPYYETCYQLYVLLMKDGLRYGKSDDYDLEDIHNKASKMVLNKFTEECKRDKKINLEYMFILRDQLKKNIETFKMDHTDTKKTYFQIIQKKFQEKMHNLNIYRTNLQKNKSISIPASKEELLRYLSKKKFTQAAICGHPAVFSAIENDEKGLSMNTAYLYLVGGSGEGKSSTINFLFGKELLPTGRGKSVTTDTVEHLAPIHNSRLLIKNMAISIIDGPGLEDTKKKDGLNLACHQKFINTHPQLRRVKPNIVMIVHKITDDRLGDDDGDEDNTSKFINVLKKLRAVLLKRLVDPGRQSVIFVLTSLESLPVEDVHDILKEQVERVKALSKKYLKIDDPPVVAVENLPSKCGLRINEDGWTFTLKNGQVHPFSLFKTITDMCEKNEDYIGKEAISQYFSQAPASDEVKKGHSVKRTELPALTRLTDVDREMVNYDSNYLLPQNLPSASNAISLTDIKVGACYDIFLDAAKSATIYKLGNSIIDESVVMKIPGSVKVCKQNKSLSCCEEFSSKAEYIQKRWSDLNVNMDIPTGLINATKVNVRSGYSVSSKDTNTSNLQNRTILFERHEFKLEIPIDELELTDSFKADIKRLPKIYDGKNEENRCCWKNFFDCYGTHVVIAAWAGGCCTVTISCESSKNSKENLQKIICGLQAKLALIAVGVGTEVENGHGNSSEFEQNINTATIEMQGGNHEYNCTNIQQLSNIMHQWLSSIQSNPIVRVPG